MKINGILGAVFQGDGGITMSDTLTSLMLINFLFAGMFLNSPSKADTLTLASSEWCPFVCETKGSDLLVEKPGFVLAIAKAIFEKKGHRVIYEAPPWSRAISNVRTGEYTGLLAALKNDAPDFIFPDEEVGLNHMCFYVKKNNPWRYNEISSLDSVNLGVIQDYAYDNGNIDNYIKISLGETNSKVQQVSSTSGLEQNFKKIKSDRINVILDDHQVIDHFLDVNNLADDFKRAGCLKEVKMYIGFSPVNIKSKEYARIFSEGILILRASGELEDILNQYSLKDWKEE